MSNKHKWLTVAMASTLASSAWALNPGETVDNFRLLDHRGSAHELYYYSDMKAVVLMAQTNGCKAANAAIPKLDELRSQYEARDVRVFMLNSNPQDDRASIVAATEKLGTQVPVLEDPLQLIGESLDATRAGEVFVINPAGWKLVYRGPVDKAAAVVGALASGGAVTPSKSDVKGCAVAMPERERRAAHAKISYSKEIAPLLIDKCVTCHRDGGIAPWQMSSYEMVKGFAPMIREVLRTKRMPPWHADPHYGVFRNDRSLTGEQVKTLVHWIEAGAPQDKAPDPLKNLKREWLEWENGTPDLIVETPAFTVPATGTIDYANPIVKNPLGKDVWVRAVEFNPGDRGVVHHILAYGVKAGGGGGGLAGLGTYLAGYAPGGGVIRFPEDTGVLLTKDMNFRFQMHYTANGKVSTDVTKIGIYFTDEPPKYPLRQFVLLDPRLRIPPNTKDHRIEAPPRTFDRDVLIYSLTAHSHYRGKASKFVAQYPDGRQEILLSVPAYDFNWQTAYELKEPKLLPKGTKLLYDTVYDNSSQNKANPDPTIEVRWGEQSWEEMIYGNVRYRYVEETTQLTQAR
jgi:hypothetical protein